MLNQLLIRCSACFLTFAVMLCSMLSTSTKCIAWFLIFEALCDIEGDLRSLELHGVPGYRSAEHDFLSLCMVQGTNRVFQHFFREKFMITRLIIVVLFGDFKTCFIKLEMRNVFASVPFSS